MTTPVVAVILAGGQGRRMGGIDKAMVPLAGQALIAHVFSRVVPQVAAVAISANGDATRFAAFGVPVLADAPPMPPGRFAGPLAGLLAGARWALDAHPGALLLSVPCDVPLLPRDLVARLAAASLPCCAASFGRLHPLVALWRPAALVVPTTAGAAARALLAALGGSSVEWAGPDDPFLNVNDPATLAAALHRPDG